MKLYRTFLGKAKEAIAELEIPFKVKQEEKKLELAIIEKEQEIAKLELSVQESKSSYPLDLSKYIKAQDELEIAQRRLNQLLTLQKELFSDEVQKG